MNRHKYGNRLTSNYTNKTQCQLDNHQIIVTVLPRLLDNTELKKNPIKGFFV